ncbi:MAG: T9SS type A sorting domain-containing protein [Candidatus Cloacimonetes bacterium]|nr:T9SS type A sorting domain-containing protein [Candidatus Cloacimonadota bacterium]
MKNLTAIFLIMCCCLFIISSISAQDNNKIDEINSALSTQRSLPVQIVLVPPFTKSEKPRQSEKQYNSTNSDWIQQARVDTTNGNSLVYGDNPSGYNGEISLNGAEPQNPSWLNYWVWIVNSNDGFVSYNDINLADITGADSIHIRWQIHGTSSGGHSGTRWFVDLNGTRFDLSDTLDASRWSKWIWRTDLSDWNFNSINNEFKIGLQSTSNTVLAVKRIWIYVYGARQTESSLNWNQYAIADDENGEPIISGDNPSGDNGEISFFGAEPQNPSWLDYYVWIVNSNNGYVSYYDLNLKGIGSADSIFISWKIHGSSSGGLSGTHWFCQLNDNRMDIPDTLDAGRWSTYIWKTYLGDWNLDSNENEFRIGLQSSSTTVLAVKSIYVYTYGCITGLNEKLDNYPARYTLVQNYPNPFNPTTILRFGLPEDSNVQLLIHDINGQLVEKLVAGEVMNAGTFEYQFDGKDLASGIYFYTLTANSIVTDKAFRKTGKMLLIK